MLDAEAIEGARRVTEREVDAVDAGKARTFVQHIDEIRKRRFITLRNHLDRPALDAVAHVAREAARCAFASDELAKTDALDAPDNDRM